MDVLRDVKASNPATKIVILTNYPSAQYRSKCMEAGADFFFDKSNEFAKVLEVMRSYLSQHGKSA